MPVKENAMVTWHQNICPAFLPCSKTDLMKTSLKSFQPSLPKRDHNQSYWKMSARCSALFPAQTMTKIWGTLLTYLFSIYRSLSSHALFVHNLLMADLSKALISQYPFFISLVCQGWDLFPLSHTCHMPLMGRRTEDAEQKSKWI